MSKMPKLTSRLAMNPESQTELSLRRRHRKGPTAALTPLKTDRVGKLVKAAGPVSASLPDLSRAKSLVRIDVSGLAERPESEATAAQAAAEPKSRDRTPKPQLGRRVKNLLQRVLRPRRAPPALSPVLLKRVRDGETWV